MRKFIYKAMILILSVGIFHSCLVETDSVLDLNEQGPNLASFEQSRAVFAAIADGVENEFELKVKLIGPTSKEMTAPVTMTVGVDPTSTAVEGTHFRIDNPTITLTADNNYLGLFKVTMLTEGIETPLDVAPVLVLKVASATGADNVVNNGKTISITMNYACPSFLEGTYTTTVTRTNYDGAVTTYPSFTEEIRKTGIGEYRTSYVGHYIPTNGGGLGVGTEGYTFQDVCGVLTVPEQTLNDYYSNVVVGTDFGSADEATGTLVLKYQISFAAGIRTYEVKYVKQ